jgi:hypothetical protein
MPLTYAKWREAVKVEMNSAVAAQLLTMPMADQKKIRRAIVQLEDFPKVEGLFKLSPEIWSLRVSQDLRMFVQIVSDALRIVALASPEQLQRYSVKRYR